MNELGFCEDPGAVQENWRRFSNGTLERPILLPGCRIAGSLPCLST